MGLPAPSCKGCPAASVGRGFVPPERHLEPKYVVVGQAPGDAEIYKGRPFVGASGARLDSWLHRAGLQRRDAVLLNVTWCRLPGDRFPKPAEVRACARRHWGPVLLELLDLPVVAVGVPASQALLGPQAGERTAGSLMDVDLRARVEGLMAD